MNFTKNYYSMEKVKQVSSHDVAEVLQRLYDSEIGVQLQSDWDAGWSIAFGNAVTGYSEPTPDVGIYNEVRIIEAVVSLLAHIAVQKYPESSFSKWFAEYSPRFVGYFKTPYEVQSGLTRVKEAENLILRLSKTHELRNAWLMNYGVSEEAETLRADWSDANCGKEFPFEGDCKLWKLYAEEKPPVGVEVLAFSPKWIDEDFNPKGIRIGFQNENDAGPFMSAEWCNYCDEWHTRDSDFNQREGQEEKKMAKGYDVPLKWKHILPVE